MTVCIYKLQRHFTIAEAEGRVPTGTPPATLLCHGFLGTVPLSLCLHTTHTTIITKC